LKGFSRKGKEIVNLGVQRDGQSFIIERVGQEMSQTVSEGRVNGIWKGLANEGPNFSQRYRYNTGGEDNCQVTKGSAWGYAFTRFERVSHSHSTRVDQTPRDLKGLTRG
jgi:hypothetical protein